MQQPPNPYPQYPQFQQQPQQQPNYTQPQTYYPPQQQWQQPSQPLPPTQQWNPQQPVPPDAALAQQPYAPYPPQSYPPQQPYPPNPQWAEQTYWQATPPPTKEKKPLNAKKSLLIVFGVLGIIIAVIFGIIIVNANAGTAPSTTLSEPQFKANAVHTTVDDLNKESNQDKGVDVYFNCTILNFVKDSNGNTVGANVDNELSSGVIQVIFPSGTDLSQINTGDNLDVWGQDQGSFSGTNAFGATIQEVAVETLYMTDDTTGYYTALGTHL